MAFISRCRGLNTYTIVFLMFSFFDWMIFFFEFISGELGHGPCVAGRRDGFNRRHAFGP
jgi:hypothetical protein